jgi:tetratricopeptide (TPR) repeat protein
VTGLDPEGKEGVQITLNLAYVLRAQGKLDEAESLYREGIPLLKTLDPSEPDIAVYLNNLAFLLRERGEFDEASAIYGEALSLYSELYGAGHPTSLMLASNLSLSLFRGERVEEGEAVMRERALAAREQWPEGHWRLATVLREQGMASVQFSDGSVAVRAFRESVQVFEDFQGPRHSWTAASRAWLAAALMVLEASPEGEDEFERAMTDLEASRLEGMFEGRAQFQANAVADYLEEHGFHARAARLRRLSDD